MNTDSYIILQQLHIHRQELIVPRLKNSSTCDLWLGRRMYLAWQGEGAPRKMMSQEIILPARIRSESLRMRKFEDSEINDGHHCAVFKKAEGVNTIYYSSHLSKKKKKITFFEHILFPSSVLETGDAILNETGVVSEDRVSLPSLSWSRPSRDIHWEASQRICLHSPLLALFPGNPFPLAPVSHISKVTEFIRDEYTGTKDMR